MEQAQCSSSTARRIISSSAHQQQEGSDLQVLINSKKDQIFKCSSSSSMNLSSELVNANTATWEEMAVAEDAAGQGPFGGCIWPPRSYSCSFCMREFRSAQALGGHMNVHRRDRARLKQCLNPNNTTATTTITHHHHHHSHEPHDHLSKSLLGGDQFPMPDHDHQSITSSGHSLDPSNSSHSFVNASSISFPFSPSRAPSALISIQKENSGTECAFLSPYSSLTTTTATTTAPSWSDSKSDHHQLEKNIMIREEDYICQLLDNDHGVYNVETDLSVGLNIRVVSRNRQGGSCGEEASSICERPKTSTISSFPFFLQSEEVAGLMARSMEDNMDLELRLGDPPKLK